MESLYEEIVKKSTDEFLSEAQNLDYLDKLDLVILMTSKMREKHITTVLGREFLKKTIEEQMSFIEEIRVLVYKRDLLLNHIKECYGNKDS